MKRYVVYHQEWQDDAEIETVCDTKADAEEFLLALIEGQDYENFFYEYVARICIQNPMQAYLDTWKNRTEWYNEYLNYASYKKKNSLSMEAYILYDLSMSYYICEVEGY